MNNKLIKKVPPKKEAKKKDWRLPILAEAIFGV